MLLLLCCCAVVLLCCCAVVLINSRRIKNDGNNEIGDALWRRPCCVIGRHFWPEKEVATPQHFSSPAYANQCRMKSFVNFTSYFYLYLLLHLFDESHLHNEMPLGCWKWQGFSPIIHQFFCWNVILVPLVGWMMQICKYANFWLDVSLNSSCFDNVALESRDGMSESGSISAASLNQMPPDFHQMLIQRNIQLMIIIFFQK